jgi:hypothetical protein
LSASVIPESGKVLLSWRKSSADSIALYRVYVPTDSKWYEKPFNNNLESREFQVFLAKEEQSIYHKAIEDDATKHPNYYRLTADPDQEPGNPNESYLTMPHVTVFLKARYDSCSASMQLNWTRYIGWENGVDHYKVFARKGVEGYQYIGKTSSANDTSYYHEGVLPNKNYWYHVEARVKGDTLTAKSNAVKKNTKVSQPPESIDPLNAISNKEGVDLYFELDTASELTRYKLIRSKFKSSKPDTIKTVQVNAHAPRITVEDNSLNPATDVYYYKLAAEDYCGEIHQASGLINNIRVLKPAYSGQSFTLEWNLHEGMKGGVYKYMVYRETDKLGKVQVAEVDSSTSMYKDTYTPSSLQEASTNGRFCYSVVATGNDLENTGQSQSNISCALVPIGVYVPNAFNPLSDNPKDRVFVPVITFTPRSYYMFVVNRWGKKVFETTDFRQGWDGRLPTGDYARTGTYMYYIELTNQKNQSREKSGAVTLFFK